jgi:rare lipoprotein A
MKRTLITFAAVLQQLALVPPSEAHHGANHGRPVTATVYDSWFHGRVTYCGGTYRHWDVSAAHPWLPCNTRVRVSHQGRVLTVPVTDRCDCSSIDLSAGAAHRLNVPLDGIATVRISHP